MEKYGVTEMETWNPNYMLIHFYELTLFYAWVSGFKIPLQINVNSNIESQSFLLFVFSLQISVIKDNEEDD